MISFNLGKFFIKFDVMLECLFAKFGIREVHISV